jgi:hypothetical protein
VLIDSQKRIAYNEEFFQSANNWENMNNHNCVIKEEIDELKNQYKYSRVQIAQNQTNRTKQIKKGILVYGKSIIFMYVIWFLIGLFRDEKNLAIALIICTWIILIVPASCVAYVWHTIRLYNISVKTLGKLLEDRIATILGDGQFGTYWVITVFLPIIVVFSFIPSLAILFSVGFSQFLFSIITWLTIVAHTLAYFVHKLIPKIILYDLDKQELLKLEEQYLDELHSLERELC